MGGRENPTRNNKTIDEILQTYGELADVWAQSKGFHNAADWANQRGSEFLNEWNKATDHLTDQELLKFGRNVARKGKAWFNSMVRESKGFFSQLENILKRRRLPAMEKLH